MLAELQELGIGLVVAIAMLIVLSRFVGKNQQQYPPATRQSKREPELDSHAGLEEPVSAPVTSTDYSGGPGIVERIYITASAAGTMQAVTEVEALAHRGLQGDRYCSGVGRWSESDNCEITMIAQEDLDMITSTTNVQVQDGQHRRNLVTRGIPLAALSGKRFRIGTAYFAFDRPRPPCQYIQQITEPGMVKALAFRSGFCVRCFKSGVIRENDRIEVLRLSVGDAIKEILGRRFGVSNSAS